MVQRLRVLTTLTELWFPALTQMPHSDLQLQFQGIPCPLPSVNACTLVVLVRLAGTHRTMDGDE